MTTMAKTKKALTRLFERLDSVPSPTDERLAAVLQEWLDRRQQIIAPTPQALMTPGTSAAERAFIFRKDPDAPQHYLLSSGVDAAATLIGRISADDRLDAAADRRGAVRLRRLFDMVGATGEPILGIFSSKSAEAGAIHTELLVAPLSSNGKSVDAFLASTSVQRTERAPARTSVRWHQPHPLLFAFESSRAFAERVAVRLGLPLSPIEERFFEDGEEKTRPLAHIRGRDVHVISSLDGTDRESVHDRLCKLLFFIATLKTNGASRVTAVTPYLAYMRKDRQTKEQDPLTAAYVARLFEAVGTDRLITMESHNLAAFQNAFRCPTIHLTAYETFAAHFAGLLPSADVTVVSPDLGGGKRADMFRVVLEKTLRRPVAKAFVEKQRSQGIVSGDLFAGDVRGRIAIIMDDLISSGTTMARAAKACKERGATGIYLCATHGLFSKEATEHLALPFINGIVVADTVEAGRRYGGEGRLTILPVASVFADAIADCYEPATR